MFNIKNLFGKNEELNQSCTFDEINDSLIKLKFSSKTKRNYSYYLNDLHDERGLLFDENLNFSSNNEFEIYQWIKEDGEFVLEGEVICIVRYVPYTNCHGYTRIGIQPPIKAPKSGILNIYKNEDEGIIDGEELCSIELSEANEEHYWVGDISNHYFNKYDIPASIREPKNLKNEWDISLKNYETDEIHFFDWLVENKSYVEAGEPISTVGAVYNGKPIYNFTIKSKVSGFIDQIISENSSYPIYQHNLLCFFHKTEESLHQSLYYNEPIIITDDFTMDKIIKWNVVGGHILPFDSIDLQYNIGAVIIDSQNSDYHLMFSLENYEGKDYIVFKFFKDEFNLNSNDEIHFMYEDGTIDEFKIIESSIRDDSPWKKLYQTKVPVTQNELNHLIEKDFSKWKIKFQNRKDFIIGYNFNEKFDSTLMQTIIKDFAKEYKELVIAEVKNHKPLNSRIPDNSNNTSTQNCHVYLMHDSSNNFYKIGISNKPEYREKTLQGEKPTITLLCSKEFPDRGIAQSIENALHSNFSSKRIRGEWFELNDSEVLNIIRTLG